MTWNLIVFGIFLVAAAATFLAFTDPQFWIELVSRLIRRMLPAVLRRKPPEDEALWREAVLRGEDPGPRRGTGPGK